MNIDEAIKELHRIRPRGGIIPQRRAEALDVAIQALENQIKINDAFNKWEEDTKECENVAERYADCDEFVCSKCGIHLVDWTEVSIDEDYDDEIHSEYVFKYCPNCGAKIKAGD